MPRPYVVGWYYFIRKITHDIRTLGFKIVLRRKNIYKQMLKKKYFWFTTEERVKKHKRFIEELKKVSAEIQDDYKKVLYDCEE